MSLPRIILPPHPFKGRKTHGPSDLSPDISQAAASLESGRFQFVSSSFLSKATSYLTDVASAAIDSHSGSVYLLRRTQPALVILDTDGNVVAKRSDTNIIEGHSIKVYTEVTGGLTTVWVADAGGACLRLFDKTGSAMQVIGPNIVGSSPVVLGKVTDIAIDPNLKQFYITDGDTGGPNNRVVVLNYKYQCIAIWGSTGQEPQSGDSRLQFNLPHAILIDPISRVWVVDSQNSRVVVVDVSGNYLTEITISGQKLYGIAISTVRETSAKSATIYITGNSVADPTQGTLSLYRVAMDSTQPANINEDPMLNPNNQPLTRWNLSAGMLHNVAFGTSAHDDLLLLSTLSSTTTQPALAYKLAVPRPQMSIKASYPKPVWPDKFRATVLMHPFEKGSPVFVGRVEYDAMQASMKFLLQTLAGVSLEILFNTTSQGSRYWVTFQGKTMGPYASDLKVPRPDWLVSLTSCSGVLPILGVNCNWWSQMINDNKATNWHWFRSDTNVPWRTMTSVEGNPDKVPILGNFAFVYWPTFESMDTNSVAETLAELQIQYSGSASTAISSGDPLEHARQFLSQSDTPDVAAARSVSEIIPGLAAGDGGLPLPVWPEQFFMTCTMTPVNKPTPLSTEATYDWPARSQRTRMFDHTVTGQPQSVTDAQLVNSKTWIFSRSANGNFKCGSTLPFGTVSPTWAASSGCKIIYTITDNPQLSPGTVTRCFCHPIDPPGQFWIWYSTGDRPVVFVQTRPPAQEGTNLALADYSSFQVTDLIDADTFDVPLTCQSSGTSAEQT